jgi:hypothetical protein
VRQAWRLSLQLIAMHLHPIIAFAVLKNLLIGGVLYYFEGTQAALWWVAGSALIYSLIALNGLLRLEERSKELHKVP